MEWVSYVLSLTSESLKNILIVSEKKKLRMHFKFLCKWDKIKMLLLITYILRKYLIMTWLFYKKSIILNWKWYPMLYDIF